MIPDTSVYLKFAAVVDSPAAAAVRRQLASWTPLWILLGGFVVVVAALVAAGRGSLIQRLSSGLERTTRIPGWAAAAVGITLFGTLVASLGFNSDVAWHIALGRDKNLFTAPHTMLVIGLVLVPTAAMIGILVATATQAQVGFRLGGLRVPWSMLPLGALGTVSICGFPLDALWHEHYGIDVTLWSPTHLLMILGGSFSVLAAWLVLAEAGVSPSDGRWPRGTHVVLGWLALTAFGGILGEFNVGVPQFQQLYAPVLVCVAGAFGLVAIRLVLGPGFALGIAAFNAALVPLHLGGAHGAVPTRPSAIYVGSAVAVEVVAWALGTERRLRFAVAAGAGVGTLGLTVEFWWNQRAHQPWHASLLPAALWLSLAGAVAAAVIGVAFAGAVARRPGTGVSRTILGLAGVALLIVLVVPLPRRVGAVTAAIHLERKPGGTALVHARLTPANAAVHARWFQAMNWQSGEIVLAQMRRVSAGAYVSDRALPIYGPGKTTLRLQRGNEVMGIAIYLPADPAIGAPQIQAVDRTAPFVSERAFMLREEHAGPSLFALGVYLFLAAAAGLCLAAFMAVAGHVTQHRQVPLMAG